MKVKYGSSMKRPAALEQIKRIKEFLGSFPYGLLCEDMATMLNLTERHTRSYLRHLHKKRVIYISRWEENRGKRGKKIPRYLLRAAKEKDAPKHWKGTSK